MAIQVPGKRWGKRLQKSKVFGKGGHAKKNILADLLITPLVDMFVIIVLFLLMNFSATGQVIQMSKDIQLPTAHNVKPLELAPVVMVSKKEIIVYGKSVGRLDDISHSDSLDIPALEENLQEHKKNSEQLHQSAGDSQTFSGDVNIQADASIPFKIIQRVMFSCSTAGYNNINFAALTVSDVKAAKATASAAGT